MTSIASLPLQRGRSAAGVFLIALAIYLAFFGGHYVMGDHAQRIAWAKSLIDHHFGRGSTDISAYAHEARYCKYGIGQSLLHVPFIVLADVIKRLTHISCEGPINMLPYALNGAAGVLLIYLVLLRLALRPRTAALRALVVGLASVWFAYSKLEYGESLVAAALLAVWYLGLRRPLLAGVIAGIAITIRADALLWSIITLLGLPAPDAGQGTAMHIFRRRDSARSTARLWFLAGVLPAVILVAFSNLWRTGNPLSAGYENGFVYPWLYGLDGLLLSPGKSVFLFSPLLILIFPAIYVARRHGSVLEESSPVRRERHALAIWAAVLLGAQVAFYAKWWDWPGDDSWGPRFLAPGAMVALLLVASIDFSSAASASTAPRIWRWAWWLLVLAGLMVEMPAVLIGPHASVLLTHERKPTKMSFDCGMRSPITLDDERFMPACSQVVATWELLELHFTGRISHAVYPYLTSSTWIESFDPPLRRSDVPWDIFWLHLHPTPSHPSPGSIDPPPQAE